MKEIIKSGQNIKIENLADGIIRIFEGNKHFIRLVAILSGNLEWNVDVEAAYAFNKFLKKRIATSASLMHSALPDFSVVDGARLYAAIHILIAGIYSLAVPSPTVVEVLKKPEMEIFDIDFGHTFREMLIKLMRGWN